MAGNEVRLIDVVRALDGLVTKTQMADGDTAGLLGVVLEVCLNVFVGMVADDLDGILVGADGTVTAETPELALDGAFRCGIRRGLFFQRKISHIIVDTECEVLLRRILLEFIVYCEHRCGRGILGTETITAADHIDIVPAGFRKRGHNVEVQRLAQGAGLFGPVEDCDVLDGCGDRFGKLFCAERTIQANLYEADLFTLRGEVIDDFFCDVADGAHGDDDVFRIRSAIVVEQLVVGAELGIDFIHVLFDNSGKCIVVFVAGFSVLEEDIAVFVRTTHDRTLGIQRAFPESFNGIHIHHFLEVIVIPDLDLLDLVGSTETIKEVDERNAALDGCKMCDRTQVHNFLGIGLSQHRETGLTASVNVGVVTEDVQCVARNGTCGNMEYAGKQFASDLVHVRDHQKKALRSRVGGRERTGCKRAVNGARRASFGLHLRNLNGGSEDIFETLRRPLIYVVGHGTGRGDRINTGDFSKSIGYMSRGIVAVHGLPFSTHLKFLLLYFHTLTSSSGEKPHMNPI